MSTTTRPTSQPASRVEQSRDARLVRPWSPKVAIKREQNKFICFAEREQLHERSELNDSTIKRFNDLTTYAPQPKRTTI